MARWGRRGVMSSLTQWLSSIHVQQRMNFGGNRKKQWSTSDASRGDSSRSSRIQHNRKNTGYSGFQAKPNKIKWPRRQSITAYSNMQYRNNEESTSSSYRAEGEKHRRRGGWRGNLIVLLVIVIAISIPAFVFVEKNLRQPLMHVAKIRVKQVATQAINGAITEQVAHRAASEELIDWKMDSLGKISGFILNYNEHMRITSSTIETVENTLMDLQHMPEEIPIGHALNSAIISAYGPKIPVTFEPLGAVKVELNTREKNAGINMVLVEVYIKVLTEVAIIIPFDTEPELVEAEIPISYLLVVGDVPMYYYDSTGKPIGETAPQAPNISVPLQPGQGISSNSATAPAIESPKSDTGHMGIIN